MTLLEFLLIVIIIKEVYAIYKEDYVVLRNYKTYEKESDLYKERCEYLKHEKEQWRERAVDAETKLRNELGELIEKSKKALRDDNT